MPDPATAASPLFAVGLALLAAGLWGSSDFGGGFLGRRAPLLVVLVVTQLIGFLVAAAITIIRDEPLIHGVDLTLALGAGVLAAGGIAALYGGLARGRMGVVAPVAAVLTAVTPALIHFVLEGVPHPLALLGMGLAIVAVVIVSRTPGDASGGPSGIELAIGAGVTLGFLSFVLSRISSDYLLAPLAVVRLVQFGIFAAVILATTRSVRLPRAMWPLAAGVGAIDLFGNTAFLVASRIDLATAAVLSSLYPVVTVLLAATVLHERMTRAHAIGIALAGVAITLIAAFGG
jgi:drug/metabolite transporter (DMT)-like permease